MTIGADYRAPTSLDEVVNTLAASADASALAGGTDLLVQVRSGSPAPSVYVDLKRVPELMRLEIAEDGALIGAAVPAAEIFECAELRQRWPGLAEAVDLIGSTQIQGRASLGGNLCNASPAADTTPALIALAAECRIVGPEGGRSVAVEEFIEGPGQTVLRPGELLVSLWIPNPSARSADAYLRLTPRSEMDIAIAGAGASIALDPAGHCVAARVVIGAVAPTARRVPAAEGILVGSELDEATLSEASSRACEASEPIDDKRSSATYRRRVIGVLVRRAVAIATQRARQRS